MYSTSKINKVTEINQIKRNCQELYDKVKHNNSLLEKAYLACKMFLTREDSELSISELNL
jgi:hypothetical protein